LIVRTNLSAPGGNEDLTGFRKCPGNGVLDARIAKALDGPLAVNRNTQNTLLVGIALELGLFIHSIKSGFFLSRRFDIPESSGEQVR
jgi:hypothetical protein